MKAFALFIVILSCSNRQVDKIMTDVAEAPKSSDDFFIFWTQFSEAVISKDAAKIILLTKLPIETRGPFDSDPIIFYEGEEFITVFNKFLNQSTGTNSSNFRETELDLIQGTITPSRSVLRTKRIGDMMFNLVEGQWRLVFLFTQPEDK